KYKERRRETENRIRHTRENLSRLNDIREELEKQIRHLDRQAKAAERYRVLKAEERKLTAELYALRYASLEAELNARHALIRDLEVQFERAAADAQRIDTEIEKLRQQHADQSESFNAIQGRFYQLGADIARVEEAIQFNQERVKQLELDLASVEQQASETSRQLEMDEGQINELKQRIAELGPQVQAAEESDQQASGAVAEFEARYRRWQEAWDQFTRAFSDHERNAEVQSSRIEHLEQLLQRLRGRLEQLHSDAAQAPEIASDDVQSLAVEIEVHEETRSRLEAEVDASLRELAAAREDLLLRERVLEDARGEVQELRHELASLQALQQAALGRDDREARDWIEAQGLAGAARLGEVLSVVAGWEQAVETVLGDRLQAIRVDRVTDYQTAVEALTTGDVMLLEAGVDVQMAGELPGLATLIRSQDLRLGSLLQGIYAAESVAVAFRHRETLQPGESIITRQGLWLGPDWIRRFMARDGDARTGVIQRAQELDTLNLRVEESERTLAELQGKVMSGRARIEQAERNRDAQQGEINALNQSLGDLRTDHGVRRVQLEEADARRERLNRERAELESQVGEESTRLSTFSQALAEALTAQDQLAEQREHLASEKTESESALSTAREAARASRDQYHRLNSEWQSLQSRLQAGETARDRLLRQRRELAERQEQLRQGVVTSSTPLPELKKDLEEKLAARHGVEGELKDVRRLLESVDAGIREFEAQRGNAEAALEDLRSRLESARVERQGQSVRAQNLLDQLQATGMTLEQAREGLTEEASVDAWTEALEATDRRINRLGPINLAAIDEFKSQSERKLYLDQQNEDLEQALETLLSAIRKIDRETRQRFKDTFETVNKRLGELFPKIFGGGHAYLELTGEDLLDTGVSLMARPPGKRNASVHLLSGGEKAMTALALIFAIFHLNPSPVCMLDEVDAPLDDANVERFAELIKDMSRDVQFVVITHNKLTMEMADQLMGVTMNEPGVSRLVSVDVEEAAAMAG
ncbi:MAG: chromosome segregation protein SMC, partial [Pseudomonadales bacterium]|nr:chromosome segregation protein SMC [Pseudomonadales bacterium]